jgi:hypothetical protein
LRRTSITVYLSYVTKRGHALIDRELDRLDEACEVLRTAGHEVRR